MTNNNEIFSTENGYKIEVSADGDVFKIYLSNGQLLESIQSISELIQNKYLPASRVNELRQVTDKVFAQDLTRLQELYYNHQNNNEFFSKHFEGINFVYKINSNISKDIRNKLKVELNDLIMSEFNIPLPIYIEGNKVNIVFKVNPYGYLKSFKNMYNDMLINGNYSFNKQTLELAEAIDKIYVVSLKAMDIIEKHIISC